jgi:hypothetical protein
MLKLWALIYRLTGWYSPFARLAEYEAIQKWLYSEESQFSVAQLGPNAINVFIGCWQADHGFTREYKKVIKLRRRG